MDVSRVTIESYRSVRRLSFPLARLNVFVGENGVGKTNLYRALQLIQAAALGTLARELAAEGGMDSAHWAGERKARGPVRIKLSVELGDRPAQGYTVEVGVKPPTGAGFALEPQVKEERLVFRHARRPEVLLERRGPHGYARDEAGLEVELDTDILPTETALAGLNDPGRYPDLYAVRRAMLGWRFYHGFRTDPGSPLRQPCLATTAPILSSDGADLAAVFATLAHIREDTEDLDSVVADAFPGARLVVPAPGRTASFGMIYDEFPKRVFDAAELSDGTLRFLALAGALLGYRLPGFVALNEPETSLHPDLLPPLGRLIARAAERAQIWVVTHSTALASALADAAGVRPRHVVKRDGETLIEGLTLAGDYREDP